MTRVLIAEDEPRIVSFLEKGFRANGFSTVAVNSGVDATALGRDDAFDLIDPRSRAARVRRAGGDPPGARPGERLPIVVLTTRDGVDDTVGSLEQGADDYVTKPFRFEELLARVRLRLRNDDTQQSTTLWSGPITLDLRSRRATNGQRTIDLTAREYRDARDVLASRRPGAVPRAVAVARVGIRLRSRARTSSTCTSATSARSSATPRSRPSAGWATGWSPDRVDESSLIDTSSSCHRRRSASG